MLPTSTTPRPRAISMGIIKVSSTNAWARSERITFRIADIPFPLVSYMYNSFTQVVLAVNVTGTGRIRLKRPVNQGFTYTAVSVTVWPGPPAGCVHAPPAQATVMLDCKFAHDRPVAMRFWQNLFWIIASLAFGLVPERSIPWPVTMYLPASDKACCTFNLV